jgi:hypothetical protein
MLIAILDADVLFPGTGPLRRVPHPARVQAAERSVFFGSCHRA